MTAAPAGQSKAAEENAPAPEVEEVPVVTPPNQPLEEGVVEVTTVAETDEEKENADPAGKVTVRRKSRSSNSKDDPFKNVDLSKLPIAAGVGQVTGEIQEYAGNAVVSLSLVGWVGDAPFKLLASDLYQIEDLLKELRKQLS